MYGAHLYPTAYNVLLAEYRGYGMSAGHPALVGMLEDVSGILQILGLPDSQIVLFGRSIGSLYAVHGVSMHPQVAGLILESGVADITQRFFLRVQPGTWSAESGARRGVAALFRLRREAARLSGSDAHSAYPAR